MFKYNPTSDMFLDMMKASVANVHHLEFIEISSTAEGTTFMVKSNPTEYIRFVEYLTGDTQDVIEFNAKQLADLVFDCIEWATLSGWW